MPDEQERRVQQVWARFAGFVRSKKWWLMGGALFLIVLIASVPLHAVFSAKSRTYTVGNVPKHDVAIVFGAGLQQDKKPSSYLESRLVTAAELYAEGKVKVFLLTGDNGVTYYDEPTAMKEFLVDHGVPARVIVLDYGGFGTYDSCFRAHEIFGVNRAILVTHGYHIPRALMTCGALGVDSVAVDANYRHNRYPATYIIREGLSLNKAGFELLFRPEPKVLGNKESSVLDALAF